MKKHFFKTLKAFSLVSILVVNSCSSDDDGNPIPVTITANDINENVDENIAVGTEIANIIATLENTNTSLSYNIVSQTPEGAVSLNENKLVVADQSLFNYEMNTEIAGQIELTVGSTTETINFTITINNLEEPFITTWRTTMELQDITIFTDPNLNYNYTVDWGDGTVYDNASGTVSHTFDTSGIYTISITGTFPAIRNAGNTVIAARLQTIESWGDNVWESMKNAFSNCTNLTLNAIDVPNLRECYKYEWYVF